MHIRGLHRNVYKLYAWARPQECLDALRSKHEDRVRRWEDLRAEGVSEKGCAKIAGFSRSSYYRSKKALAELARGIMPPSKARKRQTKPVWGEAEMQRVLEIRRANPTYGKEKIKVILERDHDVSLSVSTVGRILKRLFGKGLIVKSRSAPRARRSRNFAKGHAQSWTYKEYSRMKLGERVQLDHMTVTRNGVSLKHFQAWERRSKHIHAQVYSDATSRSAKRFLGEFLKAAPYPVISLQVDGGSEFMADFENACAELEIPLKVLPPSRPKYNGGVERGNRTFREEFYDRHDLHADSIGAMRAELKNAVGKYNTFRPHNALDGKTPSQYLESQTAPKPNKPQSP